MKRYFIVIKETPELKVGAMLQTDNGGYDVMNNEYNKYGDQRSTHYSSLTIESHPKYFQECVYVFVPLHKIDEIEKLISKKIIYGRRKTN